MYLKKEATLRECIEEFLIGQMQNDITYNIPMIPKSLNDQIAEWEFADLGSTVEIYWNDELDPVLILKRK
ncbi:hypothetical protein [Paenibacillus elgii]|uniref:hypothetical protein n=1 Tax=Paenibacillus elgii TaxID=189691 RepID=UPI00203A4750|nr:hypothetical protein [Paenibacillus elgii]MCM3274288.1 hypothetical protein [Paenibacillus elgii]